MRRSLARAVLVAGVAFAALVLPVSTALASSEPINSTFNS